MMPATVDLTSQPETWSRRQWLALVGLSLSVFMVGLDVTVVVVALPFIQHEFDLSLAMLQWVVASYSLVFAGCLMAAGVLADRFGRRKVFFIGLFLFALASGLVGVASASWLLNAARALQGFGGALLMSSAGALLPQAFQGSARTRAFGIWGTVAGVGLAFGPLVGSFIATTVGWHWAFFLNLPVAATIGLMIQRSVEESRSESRAPLDAIGLATFTGGLFCTTYALTVLEQGAFSTGFFLSIMCGLSLLGAFAYSQATRPTAMIDIRLLRNKAFVGASLLPLAMSLGFWSLLVILPLYFEAMPIQNLNSGAAVLPFTLPMLFLPKVGSLLAQRYSDRLVFNASFGLVLIGNLIMAAGVGALGVPWVLLMGVVITGTGAGIGNAQMTNLAVSAVPADRSGMASGVSATMRQTGFVLATAILTLVLGMFTQGSSAKAVPAGFAEGMRVLLVVAAAGGAAGLWIASTFIGRPLPAPR